VRYAMMIMVKTGLPLCVAGRLGVRAARVIGRGRTMGAGEQLYQKQCASCHGAKGEGAKAFPRPLASNKSAAQLTQLIAKTMPEDAPGTLTKEQADALPPMFSILLAKDTSEPGQTPAHRTVPLDRE